MSDGKLSAFVVFDEDGMPQFCAPVASMCHDHINDAIAGDIDGAAKWVVRHLVSIQPSADLAGWIAALKEAHDQSLDGAEYDARFTLLSVIEVMGTALKSASVERAP